MVDPSNDATRVRAKVQELTDRYRNDPDFRRQTQADPVATLAAAGLPGVEARVRARGTGDPDAEVIGHQPPVEITDLSIEVATPDGGVDWLC